MFIEMVEIYKALIKINPLGIAIVVVAATGLLKGLNER